MDKLDKIIDTQRELQEKMGYDFDKMSMEDRAAYIKTYTQHCDHELHEMLQEMPYFKEWKKYPGNTGELRAMFNDAGQEFVDALHFFINVALALGFTADTLYAFYMYKNDINHQRQADKENYKPCVGGQQ